MDGILLINKERGMTSHDVVNKLRKILQTKKIGHTGTLDPDATGLLVLGINKGTKIMQYLNQDDKAYQATILIGVSTDTEDHEGTVLDSLAVTTLSDVDEVLQSFLGTYQQIPPMYSAIKVDGKKLYQYARQNIEIERQYRTLEIYDIKRTSDIVIENGTAMFSYQVHGSKGLYVRTLSVDIGKKLGYPSHNYALHRTKAGDFNVADSFTLKDIEQGNYQIKTISEALPNIQSILLTDEIKHHVKNGMALSLRYFKEPVLTKIVDEQDNVVALYDLHPNQQKMKAQNVFFE